jgi:two-component system nitrogen regulation response regulator NtrX
MPADILVIDDEKDIASLISDILSDENYTVRTANNSDTALKALAERVPAAIILDIWLQGSELDGLGVLERVQEKYPHVAVIMISGHGNIETAVNAIKMGAYDFIEKPFSAERLLLILKRALETMSLKVENSELRLRGKPETEIIGRSQAALQLRQTIEKVAPTNSRILIHGGPGVGKEVVARQIHMQSHRRNAKFVVLNAASISPSRVDQELFGIQDNNPNGGAERIGLFEKAHGGTLFIDEVADMHIETQGRFLRALQGQSFTRVHGDQPINADVRVVTATKKDLKNEIEAGRFREDLYYRLNVVPLRVPTLQERREDIPVLCDYFIRRAAELSGMQIRRISEEAMAVLQSYAWPGNVRHLRNIMEWILIMASGDASQPIKTEHLPPELFESQRTALAPDLGNDIMSMPLREARESFERHYLTAQINRFAGNISKTSHFIGMERSALHRKLKMLGIHNDEKEKEAA